MKHSFTAAFVLIGVGSVYALVSGWSTLKALRDGNIAVSQGGSSDGSTDYKAHNRNSQPIRFWLAVIRESMGALVGTAVALAGLIYLLWMIL